MSSQLSLGQTDGWYWQTHFLAWSIVQKLMILCQLSLSYNNGEGLFLVAVVGSIFMWHGQRMWLAAWSKSVTYRIVKECDVPHGQRMWPRTGCIFDVISGNYFTSSCIYWLQKSTAGTTIGFIRIPCGCRSVTRLVQTNPSYAGVRGVRLTTKMGRFLQEKSTWVVFCL